MCLLLRGPASRHGKFCCCSTFIGMHFSGLISLGEFAFFMFLMIKSIDYGEFNWLILIWLIVITLPRILFYFIMCADSLKNRHNYAMILMATTFGELVFYVVNQFIIFTNDKDYCSRVYATYYMMNRWDIYCDWAITMWEVGTTMSLTFFCYATVGAYDHYHMGFLIPKLELKELERLRQKK